MEGQGDRPNKGPLNDPTNLEEEVENGLFTE